MTDLDHSAFIAIQRAAGRLMNDAHSLLKGHGLSPQQYNVLRILRGAKGPLSCTEIANRMMNRDPDMTRLLDRMDKKGWIRRHRDRDDRRIVLATITPEALEMIAAIDQPMSELHNRQMRALPESRKRSLVSILNLLAG